MRTLYEIGLLRLDAGARVLTHAGEPVALGARAVAVLSALVSRAGEYVSKSEIMDAVWPGLLVEDANLAVQISAIRRAVARVPGGEDWIETLARRGYRFVGPVSRVAGRPSDAPVRLDRKRTNLPQVLTSFVGREREVAQIKRLLPTTRLLTLTGTGGIGKTRLALQAALEVLDAYRDGVWFVDLAPLTDPALVPSALAQVLEVKEAVGQPLTQTICEHLSGKALLLVLDNCEHLLGASADLTDALLRGTAQVTVIATSRETMHVSAEHTFTVGALPLPDSGADASTIASADAVKLFVDRARQHRPRFDLQEQRARAVAKICVRLDGIPLALELAATRMAVLPVEEIERLLDQRFRLLTRGGGELPRQQTLRAMIDWSYELLDAAEQQLFARLSVFAGGWMLEAATKICAVEPAAADGVAYPLIALIDKSLVIADEDGDRYRMLETVREYAREKLAESGSAESTAQRHRDYFLVLAKESRPKLAGAEQLMWLQRLEQEHDNLRAGLGWSLEEQGSTGGLVLCGELQTFWWMRGYVSEAREWCAQILGKKGAEAPTRARAIVLNGAGVLAYYQGDFHSAHALNMEGLAISQKLGDSIGMSSALINLGNIACDQGEFVSGKTFYERGLAIMRERNDRQGMATALMNLGTLAWDLGDRESAPALFEESLMVMRELNNQGGASYALHSLGRVAYAQGDFPAAAARHEEGLSIGRALGDRGSIAHGLNYLGAVAREQGDYHAAKAHFVECLTIQRELGDKLGVAYGLEGLASVVSRLGEPMTGARIWGAAERLREEIGSPLLPINKVEYGPNVAIGRALAGDDIAFAHAWAEGRALTLEQAVELALHESAGRR